jgi:hypothetical protein
VKAARLAIVVVVGLVLQGTTGAPADPSKQVTALVPADIQWFTPPYYTDGRQRALLRGDERWRVDAKDDETGRLCSLNVRL